jgi:hypothetical protein
MSRGLQAGAEVDWPDPRQSPPRRTQTCRQRLVAGCGLEVAVWAPASSQPLSGTALFGLRRAARGPISAAPGPRISRP